MRLFTLDKNGKMSPYRESIFMEDNRESDLETLLENNPEYFFENSRVLIIGRQVTTNLNSFIDLLGIDSSGNTIVIELKRNKTPRETIAQILEYSSFVEKLDYSQLNEIYQDYSGEDIQLKFLKQIKGKVTQISYFIVS
jgi:RecB family endonuclease NucS